jgi:hypothetical protein
MDNKANNITRMVSGEMHFTKKGNRVQPFRTAQEIKKLWDNYKFHKRQKLWHNAEETGEKTLR